MLYTASHCLKLVGADASEPMAAAADDDESVDSLLMLQLLQLPFLLLPPSPPPASGYVAVSSQADGATDGIAHSSQHVVWFQTAAHTPCRQSALCSCTVPKCSGWSHGLMSVAMCLLQGRQMQLCSSSRWLL